MASTELLTGKEYKLDTADVYGKFSNTVTVSNTDSEVYVLYIYQSILKKLYVKHQQQNYILVSYTNLPTGL